MSEKAKKKAKKAPSRPGGVIFRSDGNPRWEVRIRYMVNGVKHYLPTVRYPVDLDAPVGSDTHIDQAEMFALRYAEDQYAKIKAGKIEWSNAAHHYTLGKLLERFKDEVDKGIILTIHEYNKAIEEGEFVHPNAIVRKSVRKELIVIRMMLGQVKNGNNTEGFADLCKTPMDRLTYKMFYDAKNTSAMNWRLKGRDGKKAGNGTVKSILSTLRSIIKHAIDEWGLNLTNPLASLKSIIVNDQRERTLTHEEWNLFVDELTSSRTNAPTVAAIKFARQTAARRGEVCKLLWEDVNFKRKTVTFRDTKSQKDEKRDRTIAIQWQTIELLQQQLGDRDPLTTTGPVFVVRNAALRPDTITQAWSRARSSLAAKTGDRTYLTARIHDLRHTRITELGSKLTAAEVTSISGHRDLASFKRYHNPRPEDVGEKLERLEELERANQVGTDGDAIRELLRKSPDDIKRALEYLNKNAIDN